VTTTLRETLVTAAREAVARLSGERLVMEALERSPPPQQVVAWAVGKAARAMMRGARLALEQQLVWGIVVEKSGGAPPTPLATNIRAIGAGHPLPDARSVAAAAALFADGAGLLKGHRVLLLLSGGASALIGAPIAGISLADLRDTTTALLRGGATISEMNVVRRHLGKALGGRLAQATPAFIDVMALSDVAGDAPHAIGSGPASPDPSTLAEATSVAKRYGAPAKVIEALQRSIPETPKPGDEICQRVTFQVLASPQALVEAAAAQMREQGFSVEARPSLVDGPVERFADELATRARALAPRHCFIAAGEPTVRVEGDGQGGRAQHLALCTARAIAGSDAAFVALGSDGTDGPTEAAGAAVDGNSWPADGSGEQAIARFASHDWLAPRGHTLVTGATGTNLADLYLLARPA
jgi:glycerate-2-kinase